jgi:hypothetical protein
MLLVYPDSDSVLARKPLRKTLLEKHYIRLPDVVFFEKPKNKTGPTNLNPAKFESMPRSGCLDFWFPVYS